MSVSYIGIDSAMAHVVLLPVEVPSVWPWAGTFDLRLHDG